MAQYGRADYWEARYAEDPAPYDWYQRYEALAPVFGQYLQKSDQLLVAGCGNSRMSEEMFEDGYIGGIVNIDISRTVIDSMVARHKEKKSLTWQVMNCCALSFSDSSFDAVIDKGTMDSLFCGEGSTAQVARLVSESSRVLKPGGHFVVVSYGAPENRLSYLENEEYGFTVSVHTVPKPTISAAGVPDATDPSQVHYIYVCTKKA